MLSDLRNSQRQDNESEYTNRISDSPIKSSKISFFQKDNMIKPKYLAIGIVFVLFLAWYTKGCRVHCSGREGYGQDASIRWGAGGVAGSGMYGFDPVTNFADQIATLRAQQAMQNPTREGFCDPRPDFWAVNYYPRNFEYQYPSYPPNDGMIYRNLPFSSPDGDLGPLSCKT